MSVFNVTILPKNPILRKYVKYYWAMIGDEPKGTPSLLPPITDFDMVFSFGANVNWEIDKSWYSLSDSFVCGARMKPVYIHAKGIVQYLSVTFHPYAIYPFIGIPMSEFNGEPAEINLLPCPQFHYSTEMIWNRNEIDDKIEMVEQILLARLIKAKEVKNCSLDWVIKTIKQSEGRVSVQSLCEKSGIGARKLERDFSKWIGMSPKQFIKVERFNHVFTQIAAPDFNEDWFDLVLQFGYHDQSHLIHDFKSMMEQTPEEFLFNLRNHPEIFAC
jgi:AraC-like DNA-binding protein